MFGQDARMRYVLAALLCLVPACAKDTSSAGTKVEVVSAVYPLTYAVRRVAGDLVSVTDVTPPGAEPHDVELSPAQAGQVERADLVVLVHGLQPALEAAAGDGALDVLPDGSDPHVWLDPRVYAAVVAKITLRLASLDRAHAGVFRDNARAFVRELQAFDKEAEAALAHCARKDLVTSHAAFGRFATRYGLRQTGIAGVDAEAEPSPARIAKVVALAGKNGVTTVFAESAESRPAQTVAREAGATVAVLDPVEVFRGDDYLTVMRRNVAAVQAGLGCG
jgi:zinc transport system substrate-binding protein